MKNNIFTFLLLLISAQIGFTQKTSKIDGNWILIESNGHKMNQKHPQYKTFNKGRYAVISINQDGSFHGAWAGPFSLEGKKYKETYTSGSDPKWLDWNAEQEVEIKGDTLFCVGFKTITDPQGKEHPGSLWGSFVEKWVQAK